MTGELIEEETPDPNMPMLTIMVDGTAYRDDLVICAHNYTSHFGKLQHLQIGDNVIFVDALENDFNYKVDKVETLGPLEVNEMVSSEWDLSFFTCTLGGRTRVTVRCNRE